MKPERNLLFESQTAQEWQEEIELAVNMVAGMEYMLIHRYGFKPGQWQQMFAGSVELLGMVTGNLVSHVNSQERQMQLYQEYLESQKDETATGDNTPDLVGVAADS